MLGKVIKIKRQAEARHVSVTMDTIHIDYRERVTPALVFG